MFCLLILYCISSNLTYFLLYNWIGTKTFTKLVVVRVTKSLTLKYWKQILPTNLQKIVPHWYCASRSAPAQMTDHLHWWIRSLRLFSLWTAFAHNHYDTSDDANSNARTTLLFSLCHLQNRIWRGSAIFAPTKFHLCIHWWWFRPWIQLFSLSTRIGQQATFVKSGR